MRLIRGLHNLTPFSNGCVATIGNFDGVHKGHQKILSQVKAVAAARGVPSVVMVFEPQPREYFSQGDVPSRLMRFREKLSHLARQNIDVVLCLQFNERLRSLSAAEFVQQILVDKLALKHLVVGDDFRFGCDRKGDFSMLQQAGERQGFSVENTRTVIVEGERVSSSRVRVALEQHQFRLVEALLGYPYSITGCVVHGQKLGRQLGVPTANVAPGRKVLPLQGVFAVRVRLVGKHNYYCTAGQERAWFGVANIGMRPTVKGIAPSLEVHLFDFSVQDSGGELYGQHIQVAFLQWLRSEIKFDGIASLKLQIERDIAQARELCAGLAG
ncbi:MAG: bifunctional riboflavin kinase/FMN adenylyltransferase [Proteobacteria bacterium]|nr:MAG: bifunctional riboflavin kinase/FMN adenylyltransferase [Pseudomonadota bacterium]